MKEWEWQKSKRNEDERYKESDEIATGSTQVILSAPLNDRGIKTNNIYLQMGKMCKA